MKQIETIKTGKNYSAVSVGRLNEIIEHVLPMGPDVTIQGKVFAGQAVGATGSELSFQTLVPGQDSGFLHTHKTHEELYIILKGEGQYQVDGETFPVSEGTIVRVAPDGKRALKNTGKENPRLFFDKLGWRLSEMFLKLAGEMLGIFKAELF